MKDIADTRQILQDSVHGLRDIDNSEFLNASADPNHYQTASACKLVKSHINKYSS